MLNLVECLKIQRKSMATNKALGYKTWRLQMFAEKEVSVTLEVAGDRAVGVEE